MFKRKPAPAMFRQGDVLLRRVETPVPPTEPLPRDADRVILAYGEVTGHAHAIADPGVVAWDLPENRLLLSVPSQGATLRHEEHDAIPLPVGTYEVIRQREFTGEDERRWAYVAD